MNDSFDKAGRDEGERRKEAALTLLAARRELFVLRGRRALVTRLLDAGTATADDVRGMVALPPGIGPKCFGAVPGPLAKAGIIAAAGFAQTSRPTAHARPVTVWELLDRGKAERWLIAHPDRPDPADDDRDGDQGLLFCIKPRNPNNEPGATVAAVAPGME